MRIFTLGETRNQLHFPQVPLTNDSLIPPKFTWVTNEFIRFTYTQLQAGLTGRSVGSLKQPHWKVFTHHG